jgi:competence ComEA-like helix-hairpin-helix protein
VGTRQELGIFLLVLLLALPPAFAWLGADGDAGASPVSALPLQQVRPLTGADCLLLGWPIPLNQAAAEDLQLVPGVGPVLAERIVTVREERGGFRSFSDLDSVRGIGPRKIKALRVYLFVDPVKNPAAPP